MRFQNHFFTFLAGFSILLGGCPSNGSPKPASDADSSRSTTNAGKPQQSTSRNPLDASKTPTPRTVNAADTIKPVVKAYCDAMRNKDDSALIKVYSKASLAQMQKDMREEGVKSLAEYLSSEPVGNKCDVRNERIVGRTAVGLVTTETYPNGIALKFVKENGAWKMTVQSPDFDAVRKSSGK